MATKQKVEVVAGEKNLAELVEMLEERKSAILYEGHSAEDKNIPGNILIAESTNRIYSFSRSDVVESETLPGGRVRIWVRIGSRGLTMSSFIVGYSPSGLIVEMEFLAPATDVATEAEGGNPWLAGDGTVAEGEAQALLASLPAVGPNYSNSCSGGDRYDNNCAHFLSNAFIRAGYSELTTDGIITARCPPAKRPIRAQDMLKWFRKKQVRFHSGVVQRNTGWWASYQETPSYPTGHVVVYDTNRWTYYGTGSYNWPVQWNYQW
jgi:hypothetical protein